VPVTARSSRCRLLCTAITLLVIPAAVAALCWFHARRQATSTITDKDTIVLADFTNTTGGPIFDQTLRPLLAAKLEQSPYLKILPKKDVAFGTETTIRCFEGKLSSGALLTRKEGIHWRLFSGPAPRK